MAHRSDADIIAHTHNTARYFTQTRHVAWVLLVATCLWGVYGFLTWLHQPAQLPQLLRPA
jgi:uncharacterized membrane protein YpjA